MIVELDRTHQVDVCDLVRFHCNKFGKSPIEGLPEEIVGNRDPFEVRIHEKGEDYGRRYLISHLIVV